MSWISISAPPPISYLVDVYGVTKEGHSRRICDCFIDAVYNQWRKSNHDGRTWALDGFTVTHWMFRPVDPHD